MYAGNPVIGERIEEAGSPEVRDPNVFWHEQTSKWVMILFENMGHSIFTSDNLKDWQYESHFDAYHECPELFELPVDGDTYNTKWVAYGAKGYYSIGSFDGKVFTPEFGQFSYIAGEFYAAQTFYNMPEEDGRRIQIGWAIIETPNMPFNMMMGFPTELSLRTTANGIRLFNEPVSEIEKLHISDQKFNNLTWQQANEKLSAVDAGLLHLKMTLDPIAAGYFDLRLGGDFLNYEWYQNKFNYGEREFTYNRELDRKAVTLEIIVDRTSLEVFVDEGAFTLVLPRNLESDMKGISLEINPEFKMTVKNLEIYEMKSIYPGGSTTDEKKANPAQLLIYPNPVKKELSIICDETIESYQIYSTTGCLMESGKGDEIDVSEYSTGIYVIKVNGSMMAIFHKL
jgi:sucrose-6-phosphate hydrolase SacC (GH32 family)